MNILFLFVSLPNLKEGNNIFTSLIKEFNVQGHNVFVSTKGSYDSKTKLLIEEGIPVLRTKSHDFTGIKNNIKKALAYQEYTIKQAFFSYRYFKKERIDLIITHSLPPEVGLIASLLKREHKCPVYLIQTDFLWHDAVAFGYFSNHGLIVRYYRFWERMMFRVVDFIGCPTKGNIDFIKKEYPSLPGNKFHFLPFWLSEIDIQPDYALKKAYGLSEKFVVIYGGSVGSAQRIERIVELAYQCKEYKNIHFVIIGSGIYVHRIQEMIEEKKLQNIYVKKTIPQNEYLKFLASCDVGLVILNEKLASPNFPSKSLSYFSMKVPVLAALDHVTDFGKYLTDNNAGLWAYSDDISKLKSELLRYYNSYDLRKSVRENAYSLFHNELTPIKAYQRILLKVNK